MYVTVRVKSQNICFPSCINHKTITFKYIYVYFLGKNDDDVKCDFIEFFLLWDEDKYSKKMFNTWETFRSYITCIYLYGNTLLLGMDVGNVSIKLFTAISYSPFASNFNQVYQSLNKFYVFCGFVSQLI